LLNIIAYFVRTGIEISPSEDDDEFFHNIIHEGTNHPPSLEDDSPKDDGNQYLNDTSNGDDEQMEIVREEVQAEVYEIHGYIN
jgi:hypothetical protein